MTPAPSEPATAGGVAGGGPLAAAYAGLVCDLDGVVYRGSQAITHAVESLTRARELTPLVFATNNASRTPAEVASTLTGLGLETGPDDVVTSAQAGAALLAGSLPGGAPVLPVGGPGVAEALRAAGLMPRTDGQVLAVLQGWGPTVTALDLGAAAVAIASGARWIATNLDLTLPTAAGLVPGNGALVAAVRAVVGIDPEVVGKPEPALYLTAAARIGARAQRLLAVGDRLDTDIAGARAVGMDSVWVLGGVHGLEHLLAAPTRPTYAVADLRGLLARIPEVTRTEHGWRIDADGAAVRLRHTGPEGTPVLVGAHARGAEMPLEQLDPNAFAALASRALGDLADDLGPTAGLLALARRLDRVLRNTRSPGGAQ